MHKFDTAVEAPDGRIYMQNAKFASRAEMDERFADLFEIDDYACTDFRKTADGGMTFTVAVTCAEGTCTRCG